MPKLRITIQGDKSEIKLEKPLLTAGRIGEVDLKLAVKEASRNHFRIGKLKDTGEWAVQDVGSTNGTFLNGERIKTSKLKHKDEITVGPECSIVFWDPPPIGGPKTKPSGPIVLKSRADKLKEEREAAILKKREQKKQEALAALAAKKEQAQEAAAGTFDIDSEATLDRILKDQVKFDAVLEKGEKIVTFGNYRILKRLSAGGMGYVFKAHHRKRDFDVALKVLRTEIVDEQNIARFKQEAWAISAFNHPNIVKVQDLAQHGGMYFIAMDFISGSDLLKVGFQKTLTYWQIMEVVDKMADVLRLVHDRNIWHRDIKPQNILLDRKGEVKLIDFGIATVEREKDSATETAEGLIMGTPAFLSPEQAARGKMGEIDGRADLYSLGAVMYYLLTGHRPFTGRSALEILKKNMTEMPSPPREVDELVPRGLSTICMQLLQKQPAERYQSAAELQMELEQWRKSKDGRHELERHRKIMRLRERKKKLLAQKRAREQQEG